MRKAEFDLCLFLPWAARNSPGTGAAVDSRELRHAPALSQGAHPSVQCSQQRRCLRERRSSNEFSIFFDPSASTCLSTVKARPTVPALAWQKWRTKPRR